MAPTRRSFLKLGAFVGLGALGAASLSSCAPETSGGSPSGATQAEDIAWDGQFDVIVIGFGAAGASAAISAAKAGAHVLIIDKAPEGHEGGNSRYCGQLFLSVEEREAGLEYQKALRGDFDTPDDVLEAYVDGLVSVKDTLASWGLDTNRIVSFEPETPGVGIEFPELPGSDGVRTNAIDAVGKQTLWRFLKQTVVDNRDMIDCWYESPATALIQNESGIVVGVQVDHEGKTVNVAAKNGVVMSCGGFENSPTYRQTFLGYSKMYPHGSLYNEGDGITMTLAINAKMWHLANYESLGAGLACEGDRVRIGGKIPFFTSGSTILVGGNGRRYVAEDLTQRHGHVNIGGTWMIPRRPERNIFIWDDSHAKEVNPPYPNWSAGCVDEVKSGKVVTANSLAELAQTIGIDADSLQETVDLYNESARSGRDAFGRTPESMKPIEKAPFYALETWPTVLNTQGGPVRSAKAEILDTNDKPIPHLYSAGEFGGVYAGQYQGGGNIAECITFGKIAGEQAAMEKEDAFSVDGSLEFTPGCGTQSVYDQSPDESSLSEGQAIGVGLGIGGPIWVKITSDNGKITGVETLLQNETEGVGTVVFEDGKLPSAVIEAGTAEGVDVVTGATLSSEGYLNAIIDAESKLS